MGRIGLIHMGNYDLLNLTRILILYHARHHYSSIKDGVDNIGYIKYNC